VNSEEPFEMSIIENSMETFLELQKLGKRFSNCLLNQNRQEEGNSR
jgi:hypothetical protein